MQTRRNNEFGEKHEDISRSWSYRITRRCLRLGKRLLPDSIKGKLLKLLETEDFQLWAEHNFFLYSKVLGNLNSGSQGLMTVLGPEVAKLADIAAVRAIAQTGARSQECLDAGCLPMLVHYYTPVPDLKDLEARGIWDKTSDMAGLDFKPREQKELLLELGRQYGDECDWGPDPTDDPREFYTENSSFSFGCAASTHLVLRHFKPKRLIEVGSGFSSRVMSAAMLKNQQDTGQVGQYTIVDPYPGEVVTGGLPGVSKLIKERVELLPAGFADELGEGDILFIDSGHCVRMGGDLNFLILDVLPRLAPGVVVHFHDIPLPFEYPKALATNASFRQFWTESYLLQAFLCFNDQFEILLAMQWLMSEGADQFQQAFPHYDPRVKKLGSGSFWIRRKPEPHAA